MRREVLSCSQSLASLALPVSRPILSNKPSLYGAQMEEPERGGGGPAFISGGATVLINDSLECCRPCPIIFRTERSFVPLQQTRSLEGPSRGLIPPPPPATRWGGPVRPQILPELLLTACKGWAELPLTPLGAETFQKDSPWSNEARNLWPGLMNGPGG